MIIFCFLYVGFSPDQKFPLAEFALYHNISYEWNPIVRYGFTFSSSFWGYLYLISTYFICPFLFFACFCQLVSNSDSITFYRVEFITDRCFLVSIKFIFVDVRCIIVGFSVTEIG
jgi:hypothetical protein